jgi:hypothetical protein
MIVTRPSSWAGHVIELTVGTRSAGRGRAKFWNGISEGQKSQYRDLADDIGTFLVLIFVQAKPKREQSSAVRRKCLH